MQSVHHRIKRMLNTNIKVVDVTVIIILLLSLLL